MKNRMKVILEKIKKMTTLLFYLFPINKNKIAVYNFSGGGYGDNPKYIVEELMKISNKYKIIWFVKKSSDDFPKFIKQVKYNSLLSYYHLITSKLWLDTVRNNPRPVFKRKKQFYIQTWHGGIPMKGIEKDVEDKLSLSYVRQAKRDGKLADYMLSNCEKRTELIKRAFWFDGEILEFGVPRDDVLFNPNEKAIEDLKNRYNISNKKIVLYAPSFRNSNDFYDKLEFNVNLLKKVVENRFGENYVVCMKCHPNDLHKIDFGGKYANVIDFSKEGDSQLVLSASDIVISDYSSMLLDFTLTKRPTLIYAPDYNEYISNERNLYIDLKNIAIPFAETFDQLIKNIENFDKHIYKEKLKKFFEYYGIFEKSDSAKKIVEFLISNKIL